MKRIIRIGLCALGLFIVTQTAARTVSGTAQEAPWKFAVLCDTRSNPCVDGGGGAQGVNMEELGKKPELATKQVAAANGQAQL